MADVLLTANERYALPILAPLASALAARGDAVYAWFDGPLAGSAHTELPGVRRIGLHDAVALRPRAVYCAMNWVPTFFAGVKVQLFHGFNAEKRPDARGHFRIRGMFDLYCTHGPSTTAPFLAMAQRYGDFKVVETGWPKLDPLFRGQDAHAERLRGAAGGRAVVLFASTFTPRLSAAPHLYEAVAREIARGERYWLLTLHPKSPPALFDRYRALAGPSAAFVEPEHVVSGERAADVLVADTTSVVQEFAVQRKPVATFRHRAPKPYMHDFTDPAALDAVLARICAPDPGRDRQLAVFADMLHPSRDGRASERVIAAVDDLLAGRLGSRAAHPWRRTVLRALQIRHRLGYWGRGAREA